MKYRLLLFALLSVISASAQEKGITPAATPPGATARVAPTTRAVVVGISDYQDPLIPDLKYADRDAEAFAAWLQSDAGGRLDKDHLRLMTNEQATTAQFVAALDWLLDESREGDQAIIYFSGHGDVESKTRFNLGFLLHWDAPHKMYMAGAYSIDYLKAVVSTLSLDNKAKVILIIDACRAGKLAGAEIHGSQLTNANLAQQFANEVKILSCQPNEYSLEGVQWGGGRGAFSYHLVDGLCGLADRNTDQEVTLSEIDRYLEDRVTAETAPVHQMPMTVGLKSEKLAHVNAGVLAAIKSGKAGQLAALAKVESRGIEEDVLAQVDSSVRRQYLDWKTAVAQKQFFEPEANCADTLYRRLVQEPGLAPLHNHMKRNYAAALLDDAQQMLNDYLHAPHKEIDQYRELRVERYTRYIRELDVAIELLGPGHYMHKALMGRKLFIQALRLGQLRNLGKATVSNAQMIRLFEQSIEYEPQAAYAHSILGYQTIDDDFDAGLANFNKAVELAPNWVQPYNWLAEYYLKKNQAEKAVELYQTALKADPNSPFIHSRWGMYCYKNQRWEEAEQSLKKAIQLDPTYAWPYSRLADLYEEIKQPEKAEPLLLKNIELTPDHYMPYYRLGLYYANQAEEKNYEKAEVLFHQAIALDSTFSWNYIGLGALYEKMKQYEKAADAYRKIISLNSSFQRAYFRLGMLYMRQKELQDYDLAIRYLQKSIAIDSNYTAAYLTLGQLYQIHLKQNDASIPYFLKAVALDSTVSWYYYHLAEAYACSDAKDYARAIAILEYAFKRFPEDTDFLMDLAVQHYRAGHFEQVVAYADQALEKTILKEYPITVPMLYIDLMRWYLDNGQAAKADTFYQLLLQKHPNQYWELAKAAYTMGQQDAFDTCLQKSIDTASTPSQYYEVGSVYAFVNAFDKALPWLEKAFEHGYNVIEQIKADKNIWEKPAFQELLKRYFPELVDK